MSGGTYFRHWGFSINEGEVPNIHMSWGRHWARFFIYVCWAPGRHWSWFWR